MKRQILLLFLVVTFVALEATAPRPLVSPAPLPSVDRLLVFEQNNGQVSFDYLFMARASTYDVSVSPSGIGLALKDRQHGRAHVSIGFHNASAATVTAERPLEGRVNYLRGREPQHWLVDIPTFERVRYQQLYDGIDAVFYGSPRGLEYDFEVAPHADPARIGLVFRDADGVTIDDTGALLVMTGGRTVRQLAPVAYQSSRGGRQPVSASYRVERDRVAFAIGSYDHTRPLVIDPVIAYATLLGGASGVSELHALAADRSGHAFVTGYTCSPDFPNTHGTTKVPSVDDDCDVFVTKLSATGGSFIYSTILGGSAMDQAASIAIDPTGASYIAGTTASSDFPISASAFDPTCGTQNGDGGCLADEAFVAKLSPDGSSLVYATYLGGTSSDAARGIAVNTRGEAFVTGTTESREFPVTSTAFDRIAHAKGDAFYTRLTADGGLAYSTLIGGQGFDTGNTIAIDGGDNAYLGGLTGSPDFPIKGGFEKAGFQTPGRGADGWVAKFDSAGRLLFASFFAGDGGDEVLGIAVHTTGIYLTGVTSSTAVPGAVAGGSDVNTVGFVSQIAGGGSRVIATRVIPGCAACGNFTRPYAIAYGGGLMHVTGYTNAPAFPTTEDAPQPSGLVSHGGAFYMTWPIESSGVIATHPSFSTMFTGALSATFGRAVASDAAGGVFVGGTAGIPERNLPSPGPFPSVNAAQAPRLLVDEPATPFIAHFVPAARFTSSDTRDFVMWAADATAVVGDWQLVADPAAAGGRRLFEPDRSQPRVAEPASSPVNYVELTFTARAGEPYRLWVRGMAQKNSYNNDSVWVQFSDSVDEAGLPLWQISSASATPVIVEDCTNCGVHGWGWQDNGFGANVFGSLVHFAASGEHTIRIQQREDGISIDQVMLSSNKYVSQAPGTPRDTTIVLPKTIAP